MSSNKLPKFRKPPVIETVLGVQFDPVPGLSVAHLGAFWRLLGSDWPHVSEAPAIEPRFEEFGKTRAWGPPTAALKLIEQMDVRVQIRNRDRDRMIQVQNGRLYYNWLGSQGGSYPEYDKVRPDFDWAWGAFQQFVQESELEELRPNQWEITYVNHIPKGALWDSPAEWHRVSPLLASLRLRESSVTFEEFSGQWHYRIGADEGRLHVSANHGLRKAPVEEELLVLNLTARGPIDNERGLDVGHGLCVGHETIVKAFKELTSEEAHLHWELVQ